MSFWLWHHWGWPFDDEYAGVDRRWDHTNDGDMSHASFSALKLYVSSTFDSEHLDPDLFDFATYPI
jgi:hypothetical protein